MSSALILSLAGLIIPAIVSFINAWVARTKDVDQARVQGANESTAAANKEAQDAQARMAQANAAPRSPDIVAGRLRDGSF